MPRASSAAVFTSTATTPCQAAAPASAATGLRRSTPPTIVAGEATAAACSGPFLSSSERIAVSPRPLSGSLSLSARGNARSIAPGSAFGTVSPAIWTSPAPARLVTTPARLSPEAPKRSLPERRPAKSEGPITASSAAFSTAPSPMKEASEPWRVTVSPPLSRPCAKSAPKSRIATPSGVTAKAKDAFSPR